MKAKILPLLQSGTKKLKILFIWLIIIVTIIMSVGIFIFKDFSLGYKYVGINYHPETKMVIGYSKDEINIFDVIDEYTGQLENEGYYIASYNMDKVISSCYGVIPKSRIDNENVKQRVIDSLEINLFCKKLIIGDDVFYFKNEQDLKDFIAKINEIEKIEYKIEEVIENKNIISSQEKLDEKINEVKTAKAEKEAEAKRKAEMQRARTVTSRGGTTVRKSNYNGGAPLASYVYISSYYGMRNGKMHTGVDFAASAGTHIYAWKSGTVTFVGWSGGYGNFIIVDHGDGTVSRYAHCSGYAVSQGQTVTKGQTIGYVGTTGNSTGNHLHFEIKVNGNFVNPLNYL